MDLLLLPTLYWQGLMADSDNPSFCFFVFAFFFLLHRIYSGDPWAHWITQAQVPAYSSSSESPDSLHPRKDCVSIEARYAIIFNSESKRSRSSRAVKGCVSIKGRFSSAPSVEKLQSDKQVKMMETTTRTTVISKCIFSSPAGMITMLVYCVNAPLLGLNVRWDCDEPNQNSAYPIMVWS